MFKIDLLIHDLIEATTRVEMIDGLPGIVEYFPIENSGLTVDVVTREQPKNGYVVGLEPYSTDIGPSALGIGIRAYIRQYANILTSPNYYLGIWACGGRYYLDICKIVDTYKTAYVLAEKNNQIAFYHIDTDATHYVQY